MSKDMIITSERGCSLYESDEKYRIFLSKSRKVEKIIKEKKDIILVSNGYGEMWFYKEQIKEEL